jgi:hypothetical protein
MLAAFGWVRDSIPFALRGHLGESSPMEFQSGTH